MNFGVNGSKNVAILTRKIVFTKTRKPENPNSLNPNPKVDLGIKPEPEQTRNLFWN